MANEEVSRPDHVEVELQDIRYRLHALDRKLDAILDILPDDRNAMIDSVLASKATARNAKVIRDYMELIVEYLDLLYANDDKLKQRIIRIGEGINNLHYDLQKAVYELTRVSWEEIAESDETYDITYCDPTHYEPYYEPTDNIETMDIALEGLRKKTEATEQARIQKLLSDVAAAFNAE